MSADFHIVDMENNPRKEHFKHFMSMPYPYTGVTVEVDITEWQSKMKENGYPFFLSFLYAAGRAANNVPEFRMRIRDGQVIEYDVCCSSYTIALDNGTYCYCVADTSLPFQQYLEVTRKAQQEAIENPGIDDGDDELSLFFISSLPWISFTSVTHPVPAVPDSNPRITWGKYHRSESRLMIPVNVQCNHALADGLHLAEFYEQLNRELKKMTE